MRFFAADGMKGLVLQGKEEKICVPYPCRAVCGANRRVFCAGEKRGACLDAEDGGLLFDFAVPPGVRALLLWGKRLMALSDEADCVCAFDRESGQILFSAPAGSYPGDFCLSPGGRCLAVAGGAAGEILIYDEDLNCVQRKKAAGIPCALCFLPRALAVLCAVEEKETLCSRLLLISPRGVEEEVFFCPRAPCALCALPGGKYLTGCQEGVAGFRADHTRAFLQPCGDPERIRLTPLGPLICDRQRGIIFPLFGRPLYAGGDPCDVCVMR